MTLPEPERVYCAGRIPLQNCHCFVAIICAARFYWTYRNEGGAPFDVATLLPRELPWQFAQKFLRALNDLGRKRSRGPGNTYAAGVSGIAAIKKSEALRPCPLANDSQIPNDSSTRWKPSTDFCHSTVTVVRAHAGATDFKELPRPPPCVFLLSRATFAARDQ